MHLGIFWREEIFLRLWLRILFYLTVLRNLFSMVWGGVMRVDCCYWSTLPINDSLLLIKWQLCSFLWFQFCLHKSKNIQIWVYPMHFITKVLWGIVKYFPLKHCIYWENKSYFLELQREDINVSWNFFKCEVEIISVSFYYFYCMQYF